jgi:hypothetical protein
MEQDSHVHQYMVVMHDASTNSIIKQVVVDHSNFTSCYHPLV